MTDSPIDSPIVWQDAARAQAFAAWLQACIPSHGLLPQTLHPASADASFRRYFRVRTEAGASCIIMDAPPAQEDCQPFVKVAELMANAGLNAPRVLAWDQAQGFMLLSDLGARTMLELIDAQPDAEREQCAYPLYREAVETLIRWQLASRADVLPPYDEALLSRELALFPDWYMQKHRGIVIDSTLQDKLDGLFAQIKASNLQSLGGARVYVHRDFMPRNLMVANQFSDGLPLGKLAPMQDERGSATPKAHAVTSVGAPSLGVLDFQDAVYGPITYDIASLMRDAFVSWPEDFVLEITVRYWEQARKAGLPVGDDFGEFYRAVEWMGLQRHLKILGIFARLTLRDGKPKYLADTPRFISYARNTCARYRQLGPLMVLLDEIEGNETRVGYTF
ncbi:aminoglycoside phosphotransferase family protein [Polaromonas sp. A23]|uniref:aminoglycoside phosphotransferase family protein n=1 Tax=Polaromonas sp. A23 TaxID=1944133 RepID=UPI000986ABF8|nr:phosphotransferase [Polaromonas sp. A23]OOG37166.1 aminoglycoside phosphotransferase [Polaromonas sp. A23]